MRRALKLAVMVGGISALVWGVRKRVRIAIGRAEDVDPDFHIVEPDPDSPVNKVSSDIETEGDSRSASGDDSPSPPAP